MSSTNGLSSTEIFEQVTTPTHAYFSIYQNKLDDTPQTFKITNVQYFSEILYGLCKSNSTVRDVKRMPFCMDIFIDEKILLLNKQSFERASMALMQNIVTDLHLEQVVGSETASDPVKNNYVNNTEFTKVLFQTNDIFHKIIVEYFTKQQKTFIPLIKTANIEQYVSLFIRDKNIHNIYDYYEVNDTFLLFSSTNGNPFEQMRLQARFINRVATVLKIAPKGVLYIS